MVEEIKDNCVIKKKKWGEIEGKQVYLFTITNANGSVMKVTNYGAAVISLVVNDCNGERTDVVLGYDLLEDYIADDYYMGSVIGRFANRIAGAEVKLDGDKFILAVEEKGYHLHGGKTGFNKKVWEVVEHDEGKLKMCYQSIDGEEGFPGDLNVLVTYNFDNEDTWTLNYEATTDRTTLINLTNHAYFNLDGHNSGSIQNHELTVNAENFLPVTELQVPTGAIEAVAGTPFDFIERKKVGRNINDKDIQLSISGGFDHSWILKETPGSNLKYAATLSAYKSGIYLNVFTTEPALHVYSGNYLDNISGKEKTFYKKRSGLCLETQHFPDAPNKEHFPSTVLRPGEIFRSTTIYQFITIKNKQAGSGNR